MSAKERHTVHRVPERIIDIDGGVINFPEHYHECLEHAQKMLDAMDARYVDRSDMIAMVDKLVQDIRFHFIFLKRRNSI